MSLLYEDLTEKILAASLEVHTVLGCGFLEMVYCDVLGYEFRQSGVPYQREVDFPVTYKGHSFNKFYRVDFLCFDKIILEIKATESILPIHKQQVFNYLKLSNLQLGFVINFGNISLKWDRIPNLF